MWSCVRRLELVLAVDFREIGVTEWGLLMLAPLDDRGEVLDHPLEELAPLPGAGTARRAGDAIDAGAVDGMRKDETVGPIRVVRLLDKLPTHDLRRHRHHQRRLGRVRMPIVAVGEVCLP